MQVTSARWHTAAHGGAAVTGRKDGDAAGHRVLVSETSRQQHHHIAQADDADQEQQCFRLLLSCHYLSCLVCVAGQGEGRRVRQVRSS